MHVSFILFGGDICHLPGLVFVKNTPNFNLFGRRVVPQDGIGTIIQLHLEGLGVRVWLDNLISLNRAGRSAAAESIPG
jgi:hypothetical protein